MTDIIYTQPVLSLMGPRETEVIAVSSSEGPLRRGQFRSLHVAASQLHVAELRLEPAPALLT